MSGEIGFLSLGLFTVVILWAARRVRSSKLPVAIPGPKPTSWFYGNLSQLFHSDEYGEHEFQWQKIYGPVYSVKGWFGSSRLVIPDPLAAKFVLNSRLLVPGPSMEQGINVLFGVGNLAAARGARHADLRTIMNPPFSAKNVRAAVPMIKDTAKKLVDRWESLGFPGDTVDISHTLNDAALDLIGDAILGYSFNALAGQSELARLQRNLMDSLTAMSFGQLPTDALLPYFPNYLLDLASDFLIPNMKKYRKMTDDLGRDLLSSRRDTDGGRNGIDDTFVGRLVQSREELGVHLRTILVTGQDTMGGTLCWIFYKLAKMPIFQRELREEIQRTSIAENHDYNSMPLLNSLINEVLRLYPAFPLSERVATEDCILPLSQLTKISTGVEISEILMKKGQCVYVAIASYNRLTSVRGPDAHEFRPSRWLEKDPSNGPALGPHASLLTFFGGPAVCLGWRLAILELQVITVEVVTKMQLSLPENDSVRPRFQATLVPETADGVRHLPVHIETVM